MAKIRQTMTCELEMAVRAREHMGPAAVEAAAQLISKLEAIKRQIEDRAESCGYSKRCREAIGVCGGECCRWHFPKTINRVDFLIAVFDPTDAVTAALAEQLHAGDDRFYRCPLLRKDGCIFTFKRRPVVCTSAFPCLAGADYWRYKERFRKEIGTIRAALDRLIEKFVTGYR